MHQSVLLKEVMELMAIKAKGSYIDGTMGSGGHAEAILRQLESGGRLLGIDQDKEALDRARKRLSNWESQCIFAHGNFAQLDEIADHFGFKQVDGILLDLGMSSEQVDNPERGFSFREDGPLDMRMDRTQAQTAEDIINNYAEEDLRRLLWIFGEETAARRIARVIVGERDREPIRSTVRLATIVEKAKGRRWGRKHPATKTFQAFRIAVNGELENLDRGLAAATSVLKEQGRMAVISFHSLEDRHVKHFCARHVGRMESLQAGGERWNGDEPRFSWVTRKPVTPLRKEIDENPRARSAKLRVVERKQHGTAKKDE